MATTTNFDPNSCPVGIGNQKDISSLGEKLDMAIERLTEKVTEVKEDVASLSSNMDKKFEAVDERFNLTDNKIDELKKSIPGIVNDEIEKKRGSSAAQAIKWLLTGVVGSVVIAIVTAYVRSKFGF